MNYSINAYNVVSYPATSISRYHGLNSLSMIGGKYINVLFASLGCSRQGYFTTGTAAILGSKSTTGYSGSFTVNICPLFSIDRIGNASTLFSPYNIEGSVYGIASRIQYNINYKTFTIRKDRASGTKTEYEKRIAGMNSKAIYPHWTMQAYINDDDMSITSIAVCISEVLYNILNMQIALGKERILHTGKDQKGQAEFYVIRWTDFNPGYSKFIRVRENIKTDYMIDKKKAKAPNRFSRQQSSIMKLDIMN